MPPKRLAVGIAEVGAIARRLVPVPGAQLPITCGCCPVCVVLPAGSAAATSQALALLGEAVSSLSAQIALIGAFDQDLDTGIGLDRLHLAQDRVPVELALVGFLVTLVGSAIPEIRLPVTAIRLPVTPVGLPVASVRLAVTSVRRHVPLSASLALVRLVVSLGGRLVAHLGGKLALRRGLVALVRTVPALLRRLQAVLRCPGAIDRIICVPVGE
ncbi:MAG TPA: hypothetical protein VFU85_09400 [Nocardioides sp.]|nr:hypothetical protein [Nocardioides sp.]